MAIPAAVEKFIRRHIDSVEQLEVLILLRENPEREWSAASVARELRSTTSAIQLRLDRLVDHRFVTKSHNGTYSFDAQAQIASEIDELIATYRTRRTTIIEMIFAAPSDSVRSFADAFRLRGEAE